MKVQYFGDVNDYRKFALLRLLVKEASFKIGVCWMLTDANGNSHGSDRRYISEPDKWCRFDPELFSALRKVPAVPQIIDLQRVQTEGLISGASFFNDLAPDALDARSQFHRACLEALAGTEFAFFDPDNGLEVPSCSKGRKGSSKYVFADELAGHYQKGRSALIYQHFPRAQRRVFIDKAGNWLRALMPEASISWFETAHVVFLLAARPEHTARVEAVANAMEHRQWTPAFFKTAGRLAL